MNKRAWTAAIGFVMTSVVSASFADCIEPRLGNTTIMRASATASVTSWAARSEQSVYSKLDIGSGLLVPGDDPNMYLSRDDYVSTLPVDTTGELVKLQFFGGIADGSGGSTLLFDFYDSDQQYFSGLTVDLPSGQTGWYLWTLTLDVPISIPAAGILALGVGADTSAGWFVSAVAPTIGTTGDALPGIDEGGVPQNHKFSLIVPEPASLTLLAAFALLHPRRRS